MQVIGYETKQTIASKFALNYSDYFAIYVYINIFLDVARVSAAKLYSKHMLRAIKRHIVSNSHVSALM